MKDQERFAGLTVGQIQKAASNGTCEPGYVWVENPKVDGGGFCRAKAGEKRRLREDK